MEKISPAQLFFIDIAISPPNTLYRFTLKICSLFSETMLETISIKETLL